jgi:hypothetical protein
MRNCLAETTLKLLTVLGVIVTINKVVFPRINKAKYTYVKGFFYMSVRLSHA